MFLEKNNMSRGAPIIFMMFAVVMLSLVIVGIATYYGTDDWTWIAQQNISLMLVLVTLGLALFTLVGWLRGRR